MLDFPIYSDLANLVGVNQLIGVNECLPGIQGNRIPLPRSQPN